MTLKSCVVATALLLSAETVATVSAQTSAAPKTRFDAMDTNHDGRITRAEWRGNNNSFKRHDWNGDGILSGEEVRVGASRRRGATEDFNNADTYEFDDWTIAGFTGLDHNRDNRLTRDEWHFDLESFRRADHNRDGIVSRSEFLTEDGEDDDRGDAFLYLDSNGDGRLSRQEWHGGNATFNTLDENRDGFLSRVEVAGADSPPELFTSLDIDRNQSLSFNEWHWSRASFDRLDANRDGRLTTEEFRQTRPTSGQSPAYRAGYERGQVEGRAAGREDRERNQGWDLEGQRELETADSGYQANMGAKSDYQNGYRTAFRLAYRQGWEQR